jgi:hypothetical protein
LGGLGIGAEQIDHVKADSAANVRWLYMNPFTRNLLATLLGLAIGSGVNMAIVVVGARIVPPPAGIDMSDAKSIADSVHLLTPRHFAFPFLAHAIGTFAGALVAYLAACGRRSAYSYVIGVLFLAGGIAASTMIPAPAWFVALDLLVAYLPMAYLGSKVGHKITRNRIVQSGA